MNNKILKLLLITLSLNYQHIIYAEDHSFTINNLQDNIQEINKKLSEIEQDIKNTDQQIAVKSLALSEINLDIDKTQAEQENLLKQKKITTKQLNQQKESLVQQLEAMYILHRNKNEQKIANLNKIKDINQLNRFINYLKTYNSYHVTSLDNLKATIKKLNSLDENLNLLAKQQKDLKQSITNSYQELTFLKANNLRLKKELEQKLNNKLAKLNYYKEQQDKLDNVLLSSTSKNRSFTFNKKSKKNNKINNINNIFNTAKGKLPMPVEGVINTSFKKNKANNSIFITTAEGKEVSAVYSGKVVFSNWLRGFGFITILDHGNGYMSLYGNNQALLKKADDFVEAGEIIAITGSSGGISTPGLYFELRHNGTSIDTLAWLNTKDTQVLASL